MEARPAPPYTLARDTKPHVTGHQPANGAPPLPRNGKPPLPLCAAHQGPQQGGFTIPLSPLDTSPPPLYYEPVTSRKPPSVVVLVFLALVWEGGAVAMQIRNNYHWALIFMGGALLTMYAAFIIQTIRPLRKGTDRAATHTTSRTNPHR